MIVVLFAVAVFLLQKYVANRKSYSMSALNPIEPKKLKGAANLAAHAYVYLFTLLALMPQVYVAYTSFLKTSGKIFVDGYSLDSYRAAFSKVGDAIYNTFMMASITIVIITLAAVLIAYVTVKRKGAAANVLDTFTMLPYIVPGSILGIALLVTFNKEPLVLSGTAVILIAAFVIRRLPYTIRSSAAVLHQVNDSIEEAAISLGASTLRTFFKITVPMMISGVFAGAIISWISIITELSTSIILYTGKTRTMTVAVYTEVVRGNYGVAAALSTLLTAITVLSLLLFFKLSGKRSNHVAVVRPAPAGTGLCCILMYNSRTNRRRRHGGKKELQGLAAQTVFAAYACADFHSVCAVPDVHDDQFAVPAHQSDDRSGQKIKLAMEEVYSSYVKEMNEASALDSVRAFTSVQFRGPEVFERFYAFNNRQRVKSIMYIMGTDGDILASSANYGSDSSDLALQAIARRMHTQGLTELAETNPIRFSHDRYTAYTFAKAITGSGECKDI